MSFFALLPGVWCCTLKCDLIKLLVFIECESLTFVISIPVQDHNTDMLFQSVTMATDVLIFYLILALLNNWDYS